MVRVKVTTLLGSGGDEPSCYHKKNMGLKLWSNCGHVFKNNKSIDTWKRETTET